jgi:catechol 2,3-dioxygenase-like lactoylglutathione lyase family enzyme
MTNLRVTEIKAFVPSRDFERSKAFYRDLGFTIASEGGGVAYIHFGTSSFLLQDFCADGLPENFMMHLLVEDVEAWWQKVQASSVAAKYGVRVTPIETQIWHMRDFCLTDPSGVLWRIGQNID